MLNKKCLENSEIALVDQVKEILMEELNAESIDDNAKQEDYSEWDSLTYLRIVTAIESKFDIEITPDNINRFNSVANIIKEIEKYGNNS